MLGKDIPGPRGLPFVGSLFSLARDPVAFYGGLPRQWGDVCSFWLGSERTVIVAHPDGIQQVLVDLRDVMHKNSVTAGLGRVLGRGLLTSEDPLWGRQRKLAAPSFQPRQLGVYGQAMLAAARRGLSRVVDGPRDIHADMVDVTREIVLETLFGAADAEGERVARLVEDFQGLFERELRSPLRLLPRSFPSPVTVRMARIRAALAEVIDRVVAERQGKPPGDDLLSRLMAARDEDGAPMSPEQLRDEAITVFLAGHETTALALTFALWLLASHPGAQAELRAEIEAVTGGAPLAPEHRKDLRLVEAVVQETMRLHPPAWVIGRAPTEDVVVQGFQIRKGDEVLVPIYALHRDPRFWKDPDAFRPDRWTTGEADAVPRFAYFPFGGGPRVCVGNHFAMMEAVLVLAEWIRALEVSPVPGARLELMPSVTLRPRAGVTVATTRR